LAAGAGGGGRERRKELRGEDAHRANGRTAGRGATPVTALSSWLIERRANVLDRWLDLVIATYPAESAAFLRGEKDRFRNPIGATLSRELAVLFDALVGGNSHGDEACQAVAAVVRMRAVQQLTPAAAVSFVPLFKRAVAEELGAEGADRAGELLTLYARVDELTLQAVNELVQCREHVFRLRAREARSQVYSLLRRAGLLDVVATDDDGKGGKEE